MFRSHYKHYKNYKTFDNVYILIIKCIILGIFGLILGIIINDSIVYLLHILHIKNIFIQNIIQIGICAVVVGLLHTSNNFLGWTLHNTIPGIFFITLLFSTQYKLMTNIEHSYIINNNDIKNN